MCNDKRFEGKIVLVTGGARGIGEAVCERFARDGAVVIVADINEDEAKATAQRVGNEYGVRTLGVRLDVTDDFEVHTTCEMIDRNFGRVDVLVAIGGMLKAYQITEFPVSEWRQAVEVNLVGLMITAKHVCQIMKKQMGGVIIQINSTPGEKGSAGYSAHAASKLGRIGLTQSLALEMAPYNVRVNSVCPGNLRDANLWKEELLEKTAGGQEMTVEQVRQQHIDQIPLGRTCAYEDVTSAVAYLASDDASFVTGQAINITGGEEIG